MPDPRVAFPRVIPPIGKERVTLAVREYDMGTLEVHLGVHARQLFERGWREGQLEVDPLLGTQHGVHRVVDPQLRREQIGRSDWRDRQLMTGQ